MKNGKEKEHQVFVAAAPYFERQHMNDGKCLCGEGAWNRNRYDKRGRTKLSTS